MSLEQSRKSVSLAPAASVDHVTSRVAGRCGLHVWIGFHELSVEHHSQVHKTPDAAGFFAESCLRANFIA
jgi:hypothetical protein